jgi:hypothetical protein
MPRLRQVKLAPRSINRDDLEQGEHPTKPIRKCQPKLLSDLLSYYCTCRLVAPSNNCSWSHVLVCDVIDVAPEGRRTVNGERLEPYTGCLTFSSFLALRTTAGFYDERRMRQLA